MLGLQLVGQPVKVNEDLAAQPPARVSHVGRVTQHGSEPVLLDTGLGQVVLKLAAVRNAVGAQVRADEAAVRAHRGRESAEHLGQQVRAVGGQRRAVALR